MESLNFWPCMDEELMWRWYCFDGSRVILARSAECYFSRNDAQRALLEAKARMVLAAAA